MKKVVALFLYPALVYSAEVSNPKPYPSIEYIQERAYGTTVHYVYVKPVHELELVVTGSGKRRLSAMITSLENHEHKNVLVGINGGYFNRENGDVIGTLIYHGKHMEKIDFGRVEMGISGNTVSFGYFGEADPPPFFYLLTAGPYLVKESKNIARRATGEEDFALDKVDTHPRTAIGKKSDGSLVLVVADGRRRNERGLQLEELANILLKTGCVEGINFDGGGSSTLVLSGEFYGMTKTENIVQNNPSDGEERKIANGFVVLDK